MFKAKKFIICAAAIFAFALPLFNRSSSYVEADGKAEIAMELTGGTVLHEKNAEATLPMASTTKIMTALLICEDCDLSEVITVPDEAVGVEGSSIYLLKDERISVKDLLYGLMLRSGNDAATALAVHHSKSVQAFVDGMNKRAKELGALNTHFSNPSGLPDQSHYTTAKDLCNIARFAMQNQIFAEVVSTVNYTGDYRNFTNKNKMLRSFDGANGVKTGYTLTAGRCLVSSAKRNGMDVVCVVLNCPDMYERSAEIIGDSFKSFALETIGCDKIFLFDGKSCALKDPCTVCVPKDGELRFVTVRSSKCAEVNALAKLEVYCKNNLILDEFLYTIDNR